MDRELAPSLSTTTSHQSSGLSPPPHGQARVREPSGDQSGSLQQRFSAMTRTALLPSAFITQKSSGPIPSWLNRMREPSGLQDTKTLHRGALVKFWRSLPSVFRTYTSSRYGSLPAPLDEKAIWLPSDDQAAPKSPHGESVSCASPLPSAFPREMSAV